MIRTTQSRFVSGVLSQGAQVLVLGDTPYDVISARRAGALCLGVLTGVHPPDKMFAAGARAVYQNIGETGAWAYVVGGTGAISAAIADHFTPGEFLPPLARVRIQGEGLAMSGSYRRGFRVDGRHRSHIIDPRSGDPQAAELPAAEEAPR